MKPRLTATAKFIAVLLLALVAIHPLLRPTLPWSDDGQLHLWRVVELDHCLHNGYAPYTLYDTIWRGNLAESLALGVLPWAFWRLRRLIQHGSHHNLALAALAFAILVLSHNVTALIASPLLAGYGLLIWLATGCSRKTLGLLAGALSLGLALYWRAEGAMARSYAIFAHLLDAESHIVAQHDGLPVEWSRPTTGWLPGKVIADVHLLNLKADAPPGKYLLEVGLFNAETNARLPVLDTAGQTGKDRVLLAPVSVG